MTLPHTIFSWMNPKLDVRHTEQHGLGVYANEPLQKNERLAIFGGDIMHIDEINHLPVEFQPYPMQIEERFVIGIRKQTRPEHTDYFNHSCDPNAGLRGQIFLVAMRDIGVNEQISFDYAMVVSESDHSDVIFEMDCLCGSPLCRKKITEHDWKLPLLQKRYEGYFSLYLQEKIDANLLLGER